MGSTTNTEKSNQPKSKGAQQLRAENASLRAKLRRAHIFNVIAAVVSLVLVVVVVAQQQSSGSADTSASASTATTVLADQYARADADDPRAIGSIDAPVTIIEWTDLRCPYCASYTNETLPTIISDYVNTGKVRIEFHDVAMFGDQSVAAAVAARAAGEQGMYAEYVEALFAAAPETGHPDLPREKLVGFAEQIGVPDMATFTAALDRTDLTDAVNSETSESQGYGITGVPFFIVGDTTLSGAQSVTTFTNTIDAQLANVGA